MTVTRRPPFGCCPLILFVVPYVSNVYKHVHVYCKVIGAYMYIVHVVTCPSYVAVVHIVVISKPELFVRALPGLPMLS